MIKTISIIALMLSLANGSTALAQKAKQNNKSSSKPEVKFLDNIQVEAAPSSVEQRSNLSEFEEQYFAKKDNTVNAPENSKIENASKVQIKYALLLDTEVEQIQNVNFYAGIDEWLGTKYRLGGTTKDGIDCSAFVRILYVTQFGINLPRTAREQYDATQHISRTEMKEGDLVFFNTQGGVSHVGIYLQNNKFVNASSSGVTISDLFDPYWERRFIGVGRYEKSQEGLMFTSSLN